jgi:hypothetical protein
VPKIRIEDFYRERLDQIRIDLRKEYYKGNNKDKRKVALLLNERKKLQNILGISER